MSFQIKRNNEKKKTQFSNEEGSSPMSQIEDYEIDQDSILFGDIVKNFERNKKKKNTFQSLLNSKKVNPNFIKLSLDKKKCAAVFEEDKLYEFSQRSLNPTQYRIYKKKQQQNGSPNPTPKKHSSNKVMPMPEPSKTTSMQSSVSNSEIHSPQRNSNPVVSQKVLASIIQLQLSESTHTTLLDKYSIEEFLFMAMQKNHLSVQIRKDLKVALTRNLIQPQHYREFFLVGTNAQVMIQQNQGYYDILLQQKDRYPSNYFDKIKQDVCRTFSSQEDKKMFEDRLDNVLSAIAIRNPYVQYCQGMNFIGAFILKHITSGDEEETFWIFVQLLESLLSLEMYNNPNFFNYYIKMLHEYIQLTFPDILLPKEYQLVYPFSEFFTLFANFVQPEITIQIWMNLVVSGQRALFKSMLTLMSIIRTDLAREIKEENQGQIHIILQSLRQFNDKEEFYREYNKLYINKRAFLMALNHHSEEQRQAGSEENKNVVLNKVDKQCELESPICHHLQYMIKMLKRSFSFFIYKTNQKIEPTIYDYFSADKKQSDFLMYQAQQTGFQNSPQKKSQKQPLADFEKQIQSNDLDDLMVGRFYHTCEEFEQKLSQTNKSLFSPQRQMNKSSTFRSPQFMSVKKIMDTDNEGQLTLQECSDPMPMLKTTTSIMSSNREKSKTHSTSSMINNFSGQNIGQTLKNQKKKENFKSLQDYQNDLYAYDEDDDEDGNYTYMFNTKERQAEIVQPQPRRRKSITWEGAHQKDRMESHCDNDSCYEETDDKINDGDNQKDFEQNENYGCQDSTPSIRQRTSFVNNCDSTYHTAMQAAACSGIISMDKNTSQKVIKY